MIWIVHYKDGAGNGSLHKSRTFKTKEGAYRFFNKLQEPWNAIRFYDACVRQHSA